MQLEIFVELPAGSWLLGGGWNNDLWGGDLPMASWVDELTPNNPVIIVLYVLIVLWHLYYPYFVIFNSICRFGYQEWMATWAWQTL